MSDILIVDDEENLRYSLELAMKRAGHICRAVATATEAAAECSRRVPDLALIDLQLPDGDGIGLMARLRDRGLAIPTIVMTAFGTINKAVAAMKHGALDFIQKPLSMEEVCLTVERCLENTRIRNRLDAYQEAQRRASVEIEFVGDCPAIREARTLADKIAAVPGEPGQGLVTILLTGETGTGKEVIARYIHHHSPRADRPLIQVNCTAIPETLFEAELFGYERGTFTDAKGPKKGLLEVAHEGTLLLDEIGDMPPASQPKLLGAIESGRFRRLGATTERVVDVRVVAATNSDLQAKVDRGEFRKDLFYRLKMFHLDLPPLRDRGDDLHLLADHFLARFTRQYHKPMPAVPDEVWDMIRRYPWPGNVRELAHVIQRAVLVNDGPTLNPALLRIDQAKSTEAGEPSGLRFDFSAGDCTLMNVERRLLKAALAQSAGNISEAARLLGITRGNLRHRMEKLGLR